MRWSSSTASFWLSSTLTEDSSSWEETSSSISVRGKGVKEEEEFEFESRKWEEIGSLRYERRRWAKEGVPLKICVINCNRNSNQSTTALHTCNLLQLQLHLLVYTSACDIAKAERERERERERLCGGSLYFWICLKFFWKITIYYDLGLGLGRIYNLVLLILEKRGIAANGCVAVNYWIFDAHS